MKKIILLTSLVVCVLLSSCSHRLVDFTLISSKNVELSKFDTYERLNSRTTGKDLHHIIILPLSQPNGKEAMDEAIEAVPGCVALVDGVLTYKWWWIPYIYGKQTYIIEGTPIIDPELVSSSDETIEDYSICVLDSDGNVETKITLSPKDYNFTKDALIANPSNYKKILKTQKRTISN